MPSYASETDEKKPSAVVIVWAPTANGARNIRKRAENATPEIDLFIFPVNQKESIPSIVLRYERINLARRAHIMEEKRLFR